MTAEEQKQKLIDKIFRMMFLVLVIFGVPAIGAFFIGKWVDMTYNVRPFGSIGALAVAAIISWAIIIRLYKKLTREFRKIDAQIAADRVSQEAEKMKQGAAAAEKTVEAEEAH